MDFIKKIFGQKETVAPLGQKSDKSDVSVPASYRLGLKFVEEYIDKGGTKWDSNLKFADVESWTAIKSQSPEFKAEVCLWACSGRLNLDHYKFNIKENVFARFGNSASQAQMKLGSTLLRSKLPFTEEQLAQMIRGCAAREYLEWENPVVSVVSATERILGDDKPGPELKKALLRLNKKCMRYLRYSNTIAMRKLKARVEALLDPDIKSTVFTLPKGEWTTRAQKNLSTLTEKQRANWNELLAFAASANGSKPSQKWLKDGKALLTAVGKQSFIAKLTYWMDNTKIDPEQPDMAVDVIKGLVWLGANTPTDEMVLAVSRFGENCYVKVAGIGARSKKLGNACCVTLMNMPDSPLAIAELVRLRGKIKYPSVRGDIERKLEAIAEKKGVTVAELEDASLPDFGFDPNGKRVKTLGDFTATINLIGNKAVLSWETEDGKPRKTVPAAVRQDFKPELAELKRLAKDLSSVLAGQIKAIEQSYINDRSWDFAAWVERYLTHPVRRNLARSLIWFITDGTKSYSVVPTEKGLQDLSGKLHKPSNTAAVKLWHPLFEDTRTIVAWRKKIEASDIVQPFKQAHREVYVVTDAERTTEIYSNRFAAHILRQHQFKALCEARSWTYTLMGMWDSWNIPQKTLPAFGIVAEYSVEIIEEEGDTNYGVPPYLTADQVRFSSRDENQMNITDVPAIVFSEVMRDVDLFVAVTSVANDPNWTDGGPDGRFGTYWQSYSFGDLGETAKTRRELIAKLVPKLAIADKLEIGDKFLKVQGKKNNYNIHFGSGNIMIMPGNKYLCIVKAPPSKQTDKIHLPFAGDTLLSIILSKAHMLVNDDKITDKTILNQLG